MALAPLLYNITFDSQTRILYFWDKAGHEIYHCEIPSPTPAAYDTATGTVSAITLPSAHSYTDVTFDSLRYYVKGTLSNTGYTNIFGGGYYYGTVTWTDSSLGDLSSKIKIADLNDPNWLSTLQDVFKIIFINNGISGYSPSFPGSSNGGQITAYSYNNGVHSITFYLSSANWTNGRDSGRIHFRYLDDTTTFNGLSAFDLVTISNGVLSKDTTTDRYSMYSVWSGIITVNAKYNSSPAPPLPTVSTGGDFGENNWLYCDDSGYNRTLSPDEIILVYSLSGSAYWDDIKSYGVILWSTFQGSQGRGHWGFSLEKGSNNNYFYARNISSGTLYLYALRVAVCSSSSATVITVYDSSNNPYNAFKYTLDGTDYYYVLDGTQTAWTDDLASIGYSLTM